MSKNTTYINKAYGGGAPCCCIAGYGARLWLHVLGPLPAGRILPGLPWWSLLHLLPIDVKSIAQQAPASTTCAPTIACIPLPPPAEANSIAQQALANVRTVYAFNGGERTVEAYAACLDMPMKVGARAVSMLASWLRLGLSRAHSGAEMLVASLDTPMGVSHREAVCRAVWRWATVPCLCCCGPCSFAACVCNSA